VVLQLPLHSEGLIRSRLHSTTNLKLSLRLNSVGLEI